MCTTAAITHAQFKRLKKIFPKKNHLNSPFLSLFHSNSSLLPQKNSDNCRFNYSLVYFHVCYITKVVCIASLYANSIHLYQLFRDLSPHISRRLMAVDGTTYYLVHCIVRKKNSVTDQIPQIKMNKVHLNRKTVLYKLLISFVGGGSLPSYNCYCFVFIGLGVGWDGWG